MHLHRIATCQRYPRPVRFRPSNLLLSLLFLGELICTLQQVGRNNRSSKTALSWSKRSGRYQLGHLNNRSTWLHTRIGWLLMNTISILPLLLFLTLLDSLSMRNIVFYPYHCRAHVATRSRKGIQTTLTTWFSHLFLSLELSFGFFRLLSHLLQFA